MDPDRVDLTLDDDEDGEPENRLLQTAQAHSNRPIALHKEGTPLDTIEEDTPLGLGPSSRVPERACQPCDSGSMSEEIRNLLADTGQPRKQQQQTRPALSNSITDALKALLGGSSGLDRIKEEGEVVQPSGIIPNPKLYPSAGPSVHHGVRSGPLSSKAAAMGSKEATLPCTEDRKFKSSGQALLPSGGSSHPLRGEGAASMRAAALPSGGQLPRPAPAAASSLSGVIASAAAPSTRGLPAPAATRSVLPHHPSSCDGIDGEVFVIESDSEDKDLFEDYDWLSKLGSKGQQQRETAAKVSCCIGPEGITGRGRGLEECSSRAAGMGAGTLGAPLGSISDLTRSEVHVSQQDKDQQEVCNIQVRSSQAEMDGDEGASPGQSGAGMTVRESLEEEENRNDSNPGIAVIQVWIEVQVMTGFES